VVVVGDDEPSTTGFVDGPDFGRSGRRLDRKPRGSGDPGEVFFRFVLYVLSQVVTASAIAAALRLRGQETSGLADVLLAGPVDRSRWALGHIGVTAFGALLALAGLGLGAGIGYGTPPQMIGTTVAYLPACLLIVGLAVALTGWVPRLAAPVTWTVLGLMLVIDLLGEFGLVDEAVLRISPFVTTLTPLSTGTGLVPALGALTAIAALLGVLGLVGLRRRDLVAS
jgi:ABC-2 type transport system permease protein